MISVEMFFAIIIFLTHKYTSRENNQFLVRIERISISSLTGEKFTGHCVSIISDIPQIEGNLKITIFLHIIKYMNTLDKIKTYMLKLLKKFKSCLRSSVNNIQ